MPKVKHYRVHCITCGLYLKSGKVLCQHVSVTITKRGTKYQQNLPTIHDKYFKKFKFLYLY